MSKHTSGPWLVSPAFEKSKLNIRGPSGNALAQVMKEKHPYEANARLIACAPEMLEALQLAIDEFSFQKDCCCDGADDAPFACFFHRIERELKSAINKATGEK